MKSIVKQNQNGINKLKFMNEMISIKLNREDKDFLKNEAKKKRLTLSSSVSSTIYLTKNETSYE